MNICDTIRYSNKVNIKCSYCRVSIIDSGWGGGGSVVAPFLILKSTLGECPNKFL